MTVLVTGGLGFIGHHVVQQLESCGHDMAVVDSQINHSLSTNRQYQHIMHDRRQRIKSPIYHTDITDHAGMTTVFNDLRPKVIVHLASVPRQAQVQQDPQLAAKVMIQGLVNLLELTQQYSAQRFVFVSSSMVYGNFQEYVKETATCNPQGQYGIMKLAGEMLVQDYSRRCNFQHVIVRPSAVYGERDLLDRVIAKFIMLAMRNQTITVQGHQDKLDFTHVADAARGIVQASLSDHAANKVYNITRGVSRSLLEAAHVVQSIVGQGNIKIADRDQSYPSRGGLDIAAARADFGFCPTIDLEEGIQNYYNWLKDSFFWNP